MRAMILVLRVCAGYALGRRTGGANSLALAALVVLAINPADLFRVGVQLSFLGVLGLGWCGEWLAAREDRDTLARLVEQSRSWPERVARGAARWVWGVTVLGAMIWLLTIPLVMARFHLLSPAALVLNTVIWLPVLLVLWTGFGVLALGALWAPLGAMLGWACDQLLWMLDEIIAAAHVCPGSHFWTAGPGDWWLLGFYGALGVALAFPRLRPSPGRCAALAAIWLAVGMTAAAWPHAQSAGVLVSRHGSRMRRRDPFPGREHAFVRCRQVFLAGVGHTVDLECPVVDGGTASRHGRSFPSRCGSFLRFAGYVGAVRRGSGLRAPGHVSPPRAALQSLEESIRRWGVPLCEVNAGDRLAMDEECRVEVIHPRPGELRGDNANSLVLAVEYRDARILLPGDLEQAGIDAVMARDRWPCDVLLAPHHGSRNSYRPAIAAWCSPQWVVISGGRRYDLRPTVAGYEGSGAHVLHSAQTVAVHVVIGPDGLEILTHRGGKLPVRE